MVLAGVRLAADNDLHHRQTNGKWPTPLRFSSVVARFAYCTLNCRMYPGCTMSSRVARMLCVLSWFLLGQYRWNEGFPQKPAVRTALG